jgi:hypothetical protein
VVARSERRTHDFRYFVALKIHGLNNKLLVVQDIPPTLATQPFSCQVPRHTQKERPKLPPASIEAVELAQKQEEYILGDIMSSAAAGEFVMRQAKRHTLSLCSSKATRNSDFMPHPLALNHNYL